MSGDVYQGLDGEIRLFANGLTLRREGLRAKVRYRGVGDLHIPFGSIARVGFELPGFIMPGYITFQDAWFDPKKFIMLKNERTVTFAKPDIKQFEALREIVESKIRDVTFANAGAPPKGVAGEIAQLARLVERGHLTRDEYEAQKRKLLGQS